jgi:hypothetical protein
MSLVPAELLLTAAAVFTVIKIAAEQQQSQRKPVRVRGEEEPEQRADEEAAN